MFAKQGRRSQGGSRDTLEGDRMPDRAHPAADGMIEIDDELPGGKLRVGKDGRQVIDRREGDAVLGEDFRPFGNRLFRDAILHQLVDLTDEGDAAGVMSKTRILSCSTELRRDAEFPPEIVAANGEKNVTIPGAETAVGNKRRVTRTRALRRHAVYPVALRMPPEQRDRRFEQRNLDERAAPRQIPLAEGGKDAGQRMQARCLVERREGNAKRG